MDVEVNWMAIVLAAASTMVVGSIWYTPKVFGDRWERWARVDKEAQKKNGFVYPMLGTFIASLVTAYVLAHVTFLANGYFNNSFLQDALTTGFWLWLGFTAARIFTHDAFEARRKKLTLLTVSHELVTVMVMALIIGLLKP